MAWKVTFTGMQTNKPYVYAVDAPGDTRETEVVMAAIQVHGRRIQNGDVTETLNPARLSVERM